MGIPTEIGGTEDALVMFMQEKNLAREIKMQLCNDQEVQSVEGIEHEDFTMQQEDREQLALSEDSDSDFIAPVMLMSCCNLIT